MHDNYAALCNHSELTYVHFQSLSANLTFGYESEKDLATVNLNPFGDPDV